MNYNIDKNLEMDQILQLTGNICNRADIIYRNYSKMKDSISNYVQNNDTKNVQNILETIDETMFIVKKMKKYGNEILTSINTDVSKNDVIYQKIDLYNNFLNKNENRILSNSSFIKSMIDNNNQLVQNTELVKFTKKIKVKTDETIKPKVNLQSIVAENELNAENNVEYSDLSRNISISEDDNHFEETYQESYEVEKKNNRQIEIQFKKSKKMKQ